MKVFLAALKTWALMVGVAAGCSSLGCLIWEEPSIYSLLPGYFVFLFAGMFLGSPLFLLLLVLINQLKSMPYTFRVSILWLWIWLVLASVAFYLLLAYMSGIYKTDADLLSRVITVVVIAELVAIPLCRNMLRCIYTIGHPPDAKPETNN
ncbi:MAG: hypothetical protein P0Y53_07745 [Candidatus Pseudobacter hemicellulosilyticus]|uniref:Uncharacterized protein n=1 Tax=Candidatus Pseudobacter hemicellulosilyticus TaxID=3121375 RepID=A0AAJ5WV70_9BACT|nr:MAG: hypothetical protein P0Y53_07745 [Pseudobacter sp.]